MKKSQFITIMTTLIAWIALTFLWAGKIQEKVVSNERSNYILGKQVDKLADQINETNKILYEMLGKQKIDDIVD